MKKKLLLLALLLLVALPAEAGFAHVQGAVVLFTAGSTSTSVVLGGNPGLGSTVCVAIDWSGNAPTSITVKDSNNNVYTASTHTPSALTGGFYLGLFYLINAPANATKTINATWTGVSAGDIWADEFSLTGGTSSFDKDVTAATGNTGTTVNTPTITPAGSGELLYSVAGDGGNITSPAAGATQGVWTGSGGGISNGNATEYVLSSGTGAIAPNYTQSPSGSTWACMSMAFTFTASGGAVEGMNKRQKLEQIDPPGR
jgi:hypothetical protein